MKKSGLFAFPLLTLSACAGVGGLDAGDSFVIVAEGVAADPTSELTVNVGGSRPGSVTLPVGSLTSRVVWDGTYGALETLVIPLGDVDVGAERFPPDGLHLRRVTLDLPAVAHGEARYVPSNQVYLDVVAPMRVTMGLGLDDGTTYPLAPTATAPVKIHVEANGEAIGVRAECRGVCWRIGGVAEMSDATANVSSPATIR